MFAAWTVNSWFEYIVNLEEFSNVQRNQLATLLSVCDSFPYVVIII